MRRFGMIATVCAALFATGFGAAPAFARTIPLEQPADAPDIPANARPVVGGIAPVDSQSGLSRELGCLINKVLGCPGT